jgi:DNA-binding NtrC family response regulator
MADQETVPHRIEGRPIRALRVEVIAGPDEGQRYIADQGDTVTIGTAPGNDLVLTDETVSRYHLELRRKGDRVQIEDLGSTNGTRIGALHLERAVASAETTLEIGATTIRISDGDTVTVPLHEEDALFGVRGRSSAMRQLMAQIARAGRSEVSILLLGETGSGKEVIARAIHAASKRAGSPFETVDCGTLLPTLVASELFGHEQGAFTGADRQHIGAFERADGGTVFLDEIGELPSMLQASLLGALERRRFRRVGGTSEISVDVRIVAATHRDLRSEVNAGRFRQDLFFRLAVVLARVPSLRERIEDIPILVEHFLREAGHSGAVESYFSAKALRTLEQHHWPGNVRELRNVVEATLAMGEPPALQSEGSNSATNLPPHVFELAYKDARGAVLRDFEVAYVNRLLEKSGGNAAHAARLGKMDRSYLFELIKRHQLR